MTNIDQVLTVAKRKADLHARIDELGDNDAVLLIVGQRDEDDSKVGVTAHNCYFWEGTGLLEAAREVFS